MDFHGALLASRLAGSDNRSPLYLAAAAAATSPSSGSLVSSSSSRTSSSTSDDDDEPEAEEMADITSDELEIMPGSSSPVSSGNLPPLNLPNMTSPPFGFEFACAEVKIIITMHANYIISQVHLEPLLALLIIFIELVYRDAISPSKLSLLCPWPASIQPKLVIIG